MDRIPLKVAHYGRFDPRVTTGGVETFARNLEGVFDEVIYLAPGVGDMDAAVRERIPVICDNQMVLDWPDGHPVIGFQHGVAEVKAQITRSRTDKRLARQQARRGGRLARQVAQEDVWIGLTPPPSGKVRCVPVLHSDVGP